MNIYNFSNINYIHYEATWCLLLCIRPQNGVCRTFSILFQEPLFWDINIASFPLFFTSNLSRHLCMKILRIRESRGPGKGWAAATSQCVYHSYLSLLLNFLFSSSWYCSSSTWTCSPSPPSGMGAAPSQVRGQREGEMVTPVTLTFLALPTGRMLAPSHHPHDMPPPPHSSVFSSSSRLGPADRRTKRGRFSMLLLLREVFLSFFSYFFFFITLLRYNPWIIQFTHLKYTIKWI